MVVRRVNSINLPPSLFFFSLFFLPPLSAAAPRARDLIPAGGTERRAETGGPYGENLKFRRPRLTCCAVRDLGRPAVPGQRRLQTLAGPGGLRGTSKFQ